MTRLRERSTTVRFLTALVSLVLVTATVVGLLHHHGVPDRPGAGGVMRTPGDAVHPASSGPCLLCRTTHDQLPATGTPPIPGDLAAPRAGVAPETSARPSVAALLVRSPRAPPVVVL